MQTIENLKKYLEYFIVEKASNASDRIDIEQAIDHAKTCGLNHLESEIEAIWVVRQKELNAQLIEHFEHIRGL
jgi:hypothetical protein